ncbi:MAG TPA: hypothetical protein PKD17_04620 [Cellvibrionaceae bacterium]|nr:hypothetical protein [Cellvibrionaceae bacterium]HMW71077.1 hypothetical protein [Cellvibrionaceae bacterium]HMY39067.1 hypothetical protein [Marinagarivorans sp.]HNG60489.1 hypothetical protein [Cellvibrionaceae bacterium]
MKLLHLTKIATLASLLALSNISCAADPVKPATTAPSATYPSTEPTTTAPPRTTENTERPPTLSYTTDKEGLLIPVDKNGKPFEQCSQEGSRNTCPLYNYKVNVREIKTTVITEVTYKINPDCVQVCFEYGTGKPGRCYTKCSSQLP